jgi:thiol:disulfide interchange protein
MENVENAAPPVGDAPINDTAINVTNRVMQIVVIGLMLIAGVAAYKYLHPSTTFAADGDARWNAAVERSRTWHTPALVLFTADWCPACQALHSEVLSRSEIQDEIANHYTMLTVDLTDHTRSATARAQKFGVSGIPTLIRFDAEGREVSRTHYTPPEKMLAWLREGE